MRKLLLVFLVSVFVFGFGVKKSEPFIFDLGNVCWRFAQNGNVVFPTDSIKVHSLLLGTKHAVTGSWIQEVAGGAFNPNAHQVLVPLVGTYQTDLNGFKRLNLHGNIVDLNFNDPFIFECHIDATLDPITKNSVNQANNGVDDKIGHVYAYCRSAVAGGSDYFPPNNPFIGGSSGLLNLKRVNCNTVPNP